MRMRAERVEDRRRQLRQAATKVFAKKGYHETRIADIAAEAKVAYGLVYHYFKNKEEILGQIFEDNWGFLVRALEVLGKEPGDFGKRLDACVGLLIESYRVAPEVVKLLLVEIARSPMALDKRQLDGVRKSFQILSDLIREGQAHGQVRKGIDPVLAAVALFGSMEMLLTGIVLGLLPPTQENLERIRKQVVELFLKGLAP